ncbi:acyl carrier protein [Streptomyces nanshensis]|uniref:Acyl carrier protein n=2 Tax=Streptomyces TaxID=1883 RepID=A0A1E7LA79_9ACTN|nr:acyl carrier protein [Streptomyces nanshensis]ACY01398.1 acyl carrier protein [Streptomyces amphibiosporus]OEV13117.1 acyl carrier protein [Streptomyces nanshensis]
MEQELKQYMEEQFMFEFDSEITEDTDLFKAGVLDSFGYISLIGHIEGEYGVKFGEEALLGNVAVTFAGLVESVASARRQTAESK